MDTHLVFLFLVLDIDAQCIEHLACAAKSYPWGLVAGGEKCFPVCWVTCWQGLGIKLRDAQPFPKPSQVLFQENKSKLKFCILLQHCPQLRRILHRCPPAPKCTYLMKPEDDSRLSSLCLGREEMGSCLLREGENSWVGKKKIYPCPICAWAPAVTPSLSALEGS